MATHIYQIQVSYTLAGQFAQNILHYQFDDAGFSSTEGAAEALLTAFDAANTANLRAIVPIAVTLTSYKSRSVNQVGGFEAFFPLAGPVHGLRTGPIAVSGIGPCVILIPTGQDKRRGRVFIPGFTDTDVIDGRIQPGFITAFNAAKIMFTQAITLVGGGGPTATPCIFSRKPVKLAITIGHATLCEYPATQRRRQRPA